MSARKDPHTAVNHRQTYVLTTDLGLRFSCYRHVGLKVPNANDPIFTEVQGELAELIASSMPDTEVRVVSMEDLADEILQRTQALVRPTTRSALVVSTCLEISVPAEGRTLEINRLIDTCGQIIGLGPRPGHPSIPSQIRSIAEAANGRPIVIVEDGSFTGSTLVYIIEQFKRHSPQSVVSAIVLGFAFPRAREALSHFGGELIVVEDTGHDGLLDWMPDHDFFPFAANCGRTLGTVLGDVPHPFYSVNGLSHAAPYVLPFASPTDWASIPRHQAQSISRACLTMTKGIIEHLEKLNGHQLTVGELTSGWARVSVPYRLGTHDFPRFETARAWEIVRNALNEVGF